MTNRKIGHTTDKNEIRFFYIIEKKSHASKSDYSEFLHLMEKGDIFRLLAIDIVPLCNITFT